MSSHPTRYVALYRNIWRQILTCGGHLKPTALCQDVSEESGKRQASHNIMRFGRTASGHNIMRFGRAGHNIMHFGKRGGSSDEAVLADALNEAYNDPDSVDIPALTSLYVKQRHQPAQFTREPVANPSLINYLKLPLDYSLYHDPRFLSDLSSSPSSAATSKAEKKSLTEMLFAPPNASSSLARRVLMPHVFLSSFYSPYFNRRLSTYNYNKKAERDRDNVFMHFG